MKNRQTVLGNLLSFFINQSFNQSINLIFVNVA